jgi:hypothetical protein
MMGEPSSGRVAPVPRSWSHRRQLVRSVVAVALVALTIALAAPTGTPAILHAGPHLTATVGRPSSSSSDAQRTAATVTTAESRAPRAPAPAGAGDPPAWANITDGLAGGPSARVFASVAWDTADGEYVLFGGLSQGAALGDTWAFKQGNWTEVNSTLSPPARWGAGMAYDAADGYVVLFGGYGSGGLVNGTWAFVRGQWSAVPATGPPRSRAFPAFAYDPSAGMVVMFGGDLQGNQSASTWGYVAGGWTNLSRGGPLAPPDRVGASIAFDASSPQLVLFGGWDPETKTRLVLNDTWTFTWAGPPVTGTGTWHQLWSNTSCTASLCPSNRYDAAMGYDATTQRVVLFGGISRVGTALQDTWFWNSVGWTDETSLLSGTAPAARFGAAIAPSPEPAASPDLTSPPLMLFSGNGTAGTGSADTWYFGNLTVAALAPHVVPPTSDVGTTGQVSTLAFGGNPASYSYSWNQLPTGCVPSSPDAASIQCTPTGTGSFLPSVTVTDADGASGTSPPGKWTVNALPAVGSFTISPSPSVVSQRITVNVSVIGGTPPFAYAYSGLPTGCGVQTTASFACYPQAAGTYSLSVEVTDADRRTVNSTSFLTVKISSATPPALWEYAVEGAIVALVVIVAVVALRRKWNPPRRPGVREASLPPEVVSSPSPSPAGSTDSGPPSTGPGGPPP